MPSRARMRFQRAQQKFGVAEWAKHNMDFDALMQIIGAFLSKYENRALVKFRRRDTEDFKNQMDKALTAERDKVVQFAVKKIEDAKSDFEKLCVVQENALKPTPEDQRLAKRRGPTGLLIARTKTLLDPNHKETIKEVRNMRDMEERWCEFYVLMTNIRSFLELNYIGFERILVRRDLLSGESPGGIKRKWLKDQFKEFRPLEDASKALSEMTKGVERKMEIMLGDRQLALKRLRMPPITERQRPRVTFRVGLFLGVFLMTFMLSAVELYRAAPRDAPLRVWDVVPPWLAIRLFRPWFAFALHIVGFGLNVALWEHTGVNRLLIFGIDRRSHLGYQEILELGLGLAGLAGVCFYWFLLGPTWGLSPIVPALVLTLAPILWLFAPVPALDASARLWFLKKLFQSIVPYKRIQFINFWLMDQLTSLADPFLDLLFAFCFFSSGVDWSGEAGPSVVLKSDSQPWGVERSNSSSLCGGHLWSLSFFIGGLPHICRLIQCIRRAFDDPAVKGVHMVNALKYALSVVIRMVGQMCGALMAAQPSFLGFTLCWSVEYFIRMGSLCLLVAWDCIMDWGLLYYARAGEPGDHGGLRKELTYVDGRWYWAGMGGNFALRLLPHTYWVIGHGYGLIHQGVLTILVILEVFRRCVWNVFRLENEHLNNVGRFRANRDISLKAFDPARDLAMPLHDPTDGNTN